MADNSVELKIGVETGEAIKSLSNLEKSTTKTVAIMENAFSGLKGVAAAALAVFAGREVVGFFKEGIDGAVAQQQAFAKLETQMKITGENTAAARQQFEDLADELERTTKFGDAAVISAAALAKAYGLTNDQAIELTKAATDLASVTGESLESAVVTLSESYNGNIRSLQKLVPEVKALTKEQLAAGGAVKILGDRFKGAASDEIQTYKGALIQAGNAFENFQKAIGKTIIENSSLISIIKAATQVFGEMQKAAEGNSSKINSALTTAINLFTTAVSVSITMLGSFVIALGSVLESVIGFAGHFIEEFAGVALVLDGLGHTDAFTKMLADASVAVENAAEKTGTYFNDLGADIAGVNVFADDLAQKIFDSGEASKEAGDKGAKSQAGHKRAIIQSAEEMAKLRDEAKKFLETISTANLSEVEKAYKKAADDFKTLFKFRKLYSPEEFQKGLKDIGETASKTIEDLSNKAAEKAVADAKKIADDARAAIESAAADPIKFTISKLEIPPLQISVDDAKLASAGVGILGKMLEGAAGAKSLISGAAGAFADAFIPGIGGAVSGVVAKLAEGPEATKKFIKEFIAAIPDIMDAIGESIPVVVEAFVDAMVNKGGAAKISFAIARAMSGEGILKNIGKNIGISIGSAFNGDVIARKITQGFTDGAAVIAFAIRDAFTSVVDIFATGGQAIADSISHFFTDFLPSDVQAAFAQVFDFFGVALPGLVDSAFSGIVYLFNDALPGFVNDAFKPVIDFLDQFKIDITGGETGKVFGNDPLVKGAAGFQKAIATGGVSIITDGFGLHALGGIIGANSGAAISPIGLDNVPVLAQKGEMILNQSQQASLFSMIKNGTGGGSNAILQQIVDLLQMPQITVATAKVDGKAFADISLQQSRQRARTTA